MQERGEGALLLAQNNKGPGMHVDAAGAFARDATFIALATLKGIVSGDT